MTRPLLSCALTVTVLLAGACDDRGLTGHPDGGDGGNGGGAAPDGGTGGAGGGLGGAGGGLGGSGGGGTGGGDGGSGPVYTTREFVNGLAYGNGTFVAVGNEDTVTDANNSLGVYFVSTDGIAWTRVVGEPNMPADAVAFGNGRFVALATGFLGTSLIPFARAFESTDGLAWTGTDLPDPLPLGDIAFGDGMFVVVGKGTLIQSTDGLAWAPFGPPLGSAFAGGTGVVFSGAHFVVWSGDSSSVLASGGSDWQSVDLPGAPYYRMGDLRVVNGAFVGRTVNDCCYGEDPAAVRWGLVSSGDGLTWAALQQGLTTYPPLTVIDSGTACVAFQGGNLMSGPTCDALAVGFSDGNFMPRQALYAAGVYVVTGDGGILSSPDGLVWTKRVWSH
jgi:hypothetical protein